MHRNNRKELAEETLSIIEKGEYRNNLNKQVSIKEETEKAIRNSKLFRPEDFPTEFNPTKIAGETKIELTDETTLEAAKRICKKDENANPFVLNFASAMSPGGGFLSGAQAQEESLARSSSLYPTLQANFEMYKFNRRYPSIFFSDFMIYSPDVPVFRNDDGSLIQKPYQVTFLTSPAVDVRRVREKEPNKLEQIEFINKERAKRFLWIAHKYEHQTLILGAWGCGVFQNEPITIAKMFKHLLEGEFKNCFERVIFAIYDKTQTKQVYNAFVEVFRK